MIARAVPPASRASRFLWMGSLVALVITVAWILVVVANGGSPSDAASGLRFPIVAGFLMAVGSLPGQSDARAISGRGALAFLHLIAAGLVLAA